VAAVEVVVVVVAVDDVGGGDESDPFRKEVSDDSAA
jgi:hypothetical protein